MTFKSLKPALLFTLLLAVMALFLTAGSYQPAAAGEDLKTPDEARLTETMRRMLADQKPAENLQPLPFTPCVGGMAGSYPCENVDLMAFMPLATIGGGNGNDVWGWTDPQTGKEYAIMGRTNGSAFVDISDPVNPIYLGNLPTQTGNSTWRDIKVYNNYAFIVSEASGHGMQVFDLTRLRSVPTPPVTFTVDAHYNQFGNAHNIAINEESGFAYAIGSGTCSGGLHMVNIQNPLAPTNAGCFSADGYTHDTQCVTYNGPDTDHVGDEICFNSNEDTVTIVDVTNKAAPVQLARQGYAGSAYTHQGWLTEDHTYFLVDDELDEQNNGHNTRTYIWNVSNLEAPVLIGNFTAPVGAIDHNLYTKNGYVYQGNYQGGLRILDAANVASGSMTQYGFFDIYPAGNSAAFNGAWSVFPYYDSGLVVISGIEQGLFIVRPNMAADFNLTATPNSINVCVGDDAVYEVTATSILEFDDPVTLTAAGVPVPAAAVFGSNPITPTASTSMTIDTTGVTAGNYAIDVIGTSVTATHTTTVNMEVVAGVPTVPGLVSPADEAQGQPTAINFSWNSVSGATSYHIQVASDINFTTLVYSDTVAGTAASVSGLATSTTYYWRVKASNNCGDGSYSAPFEFATGNISLYCRTPNLPLPDDPDVSDTMIITTTGMIMDLNLLIDASHTWVGDTSFTLLHQNTSSSVNAINRPGVPASTNGCSANNINVALDDEGVDGPVENQCSTTSPALFGNPTPNNPLSAFDGQDVNGTWILQYSDGAGSDTGTLHEWCIEVVTESEPTADIELAVTVGTDPHTCAGTDTLNLPMGGDDVIYCYTVTNTGVFTLTNHDLVDSEWGTLLSDFPFILIPGASTFLTHTETVTETTINNATWTADDGTEIASDSDSATVNVALPAPAVELAVTVGTDPHTCATTDSVNLPAGGGEATYCYEVTNTGNITLTTHDLVDSEWGTLLDNFSYSLAPGASVAVTETATVMAPVVNTGTWTAGDGSVEVSDTDTASVTVTPSVFDLIVSADQTITGTAGATITYTITITNAGNVADTAELMAMGHSWDTTYPMSVTVGSGETVEVEIVVTIPATATHPMSDTAMIHVTSAGDSGEMEMVSLTTLVSETPAAAYRLYLPVINREP